MYRPGLPGIMLRGIRHASRMRRQGHGAHLLYYLLKLPCAVAEECHYLGIDEFADRNDVDQTIGVDVTDANGARSSVHWQGKGAKRTIPIAKMHDNAGGSRQGHVQQTVVVKVGGPGQDVHIVGRVEDGRAESPVAQTWVKRCGAGASRYCYYKDIVDGVAVKIARHDLAGSRGAGRRTLWGIESAITIAEQNR